MKLNLKLLIYFLSYPLLWIISKIVSFIFSSREVSVEKYSMKTNRNSENGDENIRFSIKKTLNIKNRSKNTLRVVHLTDIHFDTVPSKSSILTKYLPPLFHIISHSTLEEIIEKTNELEPDIIILTGDYVQTEAQPIQELCDKYLRRLKCKGPRLIFASLGNHDLRDDKSVIINALQNVDIFVMEQNSLTTYTPIVRIYPSQNMKLVPIDVLSQKNEKQVDDYIEIVGFLDGHDVEFQNRATQTMSFFGCEGNENNLEENSMTKHNSKHNLLRLVLLHDPNNLKTLRESNFAFDLVLLGHTHGGQVCIPFPRCLLKMDAVRNRLETDQKSIFIRYPLVALLKDLYRFLPECVQRFGERNLLIIRRLLYAVRDWEFGIGLNRTPIGHAYTNRGCASHPPGRLLCSPEIAVFNIDMTEK